MKKRNPMKAPLASDFRMAHSARTGDHCPTSGWWVALNEEGNRYFLTEGSIMPSINGAPGNWTLAMSENQQPKVTSHGTVPRQFAFDVL